MTGARRSLVAVALALHVACSAPAGPGGEPSGPAPSHGDAAAGSGTARKRAQALFQAQFQAATSGDRAALVATFDDGAILLAHSDHPARDTVTAEWLALAPSMQITQSSGAAFAAGGDERAVWLVAQVTLDEQGASELGGAGAAKAVVRISELATAAAGWKVVAAAVGVARRPDGYPNIATMPGKTDPGPLARLAGQPAALAQAIGDDTIVLGPGPADVIAVGGAARAVVGAWAQKPLVIDGEVREVRTGDVGFLQAHLTGGPSLLMVATFGAGAPHVVLVHVLSV